MSARKLLQHVYDRLKADHLDRLGYDVPVRYRSAFVHWGGGADAQYIYRRFAARLAAGARVLIVGVMGGRDYFLFRNLGYDVVAVDLGAQPDIAPITIANVEHDLPFADATFDAVVMGEVLEHLGDDVGALRNVRRVLRADGLLMVSLPFYNDWEEGHVRIHSPRSGRRLLGLAGFDVVDYLERPALIAPNWLNPIQHGLSLACYALRRRSGYDGLGRAIGAFSWYVGHWRGLAPLRRLSRRYGGYYLARKGRALDHVALNRTLYTVPENARERATG